MTTLWLKRVGNVLHGADDESIGELSKLPFNKHLRCEVKQPRNGRFSALYWVLCTRLANGIGSNAETISDVLKYKTGHVTIVRTKSDGELRFPKSIAFHNMDETAFREFFNRCLTVIFEEWRVDREAFSGLIDMKGEYGS